MTIADIFAVGTELKLGDRVFSLRPMTLTEQGQFQRWLEQRAHDAVERGTEPQALKDRRHDRIYADSALGKYEWGGPYATEAFWTPAGLCKALALVLADQKATHEDVEGLVAQRLKEVAAVMLGRAAADPKAAAAVLATLGLPSDWFSNNCSTPRSTAPSPNSGDSPTPSSCSSTPSSEAPMG